MGLNCPMNPAHPQNNIAEFPLHLLKPLTAGLDLNRRKYSDRLTYHVRRYLNRCPAAKIGKTIRHAVKRHGIFYYKHIPFPYKLALPRNTGTGFEQPFVTRKVEEYIIYLFFVILSHNGIMNFFFNKSTFFNIMLDNI